MGHDKLCPKKKKFLFRQPHQDLEGVDTDLAHVLDLVLVGHVDNVNHNKF